MWQGRVSEQHSWVSGVGPMSNHGMVSLGKLAIPALKNMFSMETFPAAQSIYIYIYTSAILQFKSHK